MIPPDPRFHTHTPLAEGLRDLLKELEERLSLNAPITACLAGGMAVHLYTANRVTTDVDAEFGGKIYLPNDLVVEVALEDGSQQLIYIDPNYSTSFALMHEDYAEDAIPVDLGLDYIRVKVLSPVDLAVSKIARFADNDKEDIAALVRLNLTSADEIESRAKSALPGFVGGMRNLELNVRDAVKMAREIEREHSSSSDAQSLIETSKPLTPRL
jgi:hypothetical protein